MKKLLSILFLAFITVNAINAKKRMPSGISLQKSKTLSHKTAM